MKKETQKFTFKIGDLVLLPGLSRKGNVISSWFEKEMWFGQGYEIEKVVVRIEYDLSLEADYRVYDAQKLTSYSESIHELANRTKLIEDLIGITKKDSNKKKSWW